MDKGRPNLSQLADEIASLVEWEREAYGEIGIPNVAEESAPTPASSASANSAPAEPAPHGPEACQNLDELKALCETSEALRTDLEGTRLVFGTGNPSADLMLIGEAPGLHEDRMGEPFVGKAGELLNKILEAIRFRRDEVYIANILKHRPPDNRDPSPEERERSLPYLMRQIELIDPKLILCLGRVSATALLRRDEPLKSLRGRFHPFAGRELLVTYHPAALLRNPQWKRATWEDVQRLRERFDQLAGQS